MKRIDRKQAARLPRRIATTLGELIAAAYEAAGPSPRRIERAARILTRSPLAKAMNRHLEFVEA